MVEQLARLKLDQMESAQPGMSEDDIVQLESDLGLQLPADFREFLSIAEVVGVDWGFPEMEVRVGSRLEPWTDSWFFRSGRLIADLKQAVLDHYLDGLIEDGTLIDEDWGHDFLPFSGNSPTHWFCFDMSIEPWPVVFFDTEGYWHRASHFGGIRYVADNFNDFLGNMVLRETYESSDEEHAPYSSDTQRAWDKRLDDWLGVTRTI